MSRKKVVLGTLVLGMLLIASLARGALNCSVYDSCQCTYWPASVSQPEGACWIEETCDGEPTHLFKLECDCDEIRFIPANC